MFESLPETKPDAILGLMAAFREDSRSNKIDLGVGIYKDAQGNTPIVSAVKKAEELLLAKQHTKAYVGPLGSDAFCAAMIQQVLGLQFDTDRVTCAQSVGGSGALRILAELLKIARPTAKIWVSDPTWPNHIPLLTAAGFAINTYPYFNTSTCELDFDGMLSCLQSVDAGDIVLFHACCHNPTGADLSIEQWQQVAQICKQRSLFPFIDFAYQGFADGLDTDAAGVRLLAEELPELVIAASCSKNLGFYRERVGAAVVVAQNATHALQALDNLSSVIRSNYSMPPDHGAATTAMVLTQPTLHKDWLAELETMRLRMTTLREEFAAALRKRTNSDRFDYIKSQKGMFSRLPLTTEQITRLREDHAVYIVGDGRINIAGLPDNDLDELAEIIVSVL